jgi:hypothetical protein
MTFFCTSVTVLALIHLESPSCQLFSLFSGQISDKLTSSDPAHYGAEYSSSEDHGTCHMNFLGN